MKMIPFVHQNEAIENILHSSNGLLNKERTQFISACGTGKTYTALWSVEKYLFEELKLDESLTLFFYPSLALISQSFNAYKEQTTIKKYNPLFICSDNNIANNEDMKTEELQEEVENNTVTTNKLLIGKYLLSEIKHKVIFCTYQSSALLVEVVNTLNIKIDITVYDEAHNVAVRKDFKKNSLSSILHDKNNSITKNSFLNTKKRLFMTATPKFVEVKLNNDLDAKELVYSMDNEEYFGKISHEFSMREAIGKGIISDYKLVIIKIDKEFLEANNTISSQESDMDAIKTLAVVKAMEKYKIKKAIAFAKTVQDSKIFTKNIKKFHKHLKAEHIDGKMNSKLKKQKLKRFAASDSYILSNSKLLSEGVDVPEVDMVVFLHNTKSLRDIVQRVGRSQRIPMLHRINNIEKTAYIFVPFLDQEIASSKNLEAEMLLNIINSLKNVDKNMQDYSQYGLISLSDEDYLAMKKRLKFLNKLQNKTPSQQAEAKRIESILFSHEARQGRVITEDVHSLKYKRSNQYSNEYESKRAEFRRYVDTIIVGKNYKNEKRWDEMYLALKSYILVNNKLPSLKTIYKKFSIGVWLMQQIGMKKKRLLSIAREQKLLMLDENIFKGKFKTDWENYYDALTKFYKLYTRTPKEAEKYNMLNIGRWLVNQRYAFSTGTLDEDKKKLLLKINSNIFKSVHEIKWENKYEKLIKFCKENNSHPPFNNREIGEWFIVQKRVYHKQLLNKERKKKIEFVLKTWKSYISTYRTKKNPNKKDKNV